MTLALSGDHIANETDNNKERDPKQKKHANWREVHPLRPELQWQIDSHNTNHEQGAYHRPPPTLEEHVLRFLPHNYEDGTHAFSSSTSLGHTSSILHFP